MTSADSLKILFEMQWPQSHMQDRTKSPMAGILVSFLI